MRDRRHDALRIHRKTTDGRWFAAVAACCLAAVAIALVSQHRFDMQPCPWCILQRLIFIAVAAAAIVGSAGSVVLLRATSASAVMILSLTGVASAAWQHFQAAASASCKLTYADRIIGSFHLDTAIPAVFEPRASCADAAVNLLGIPYDFWSLALFMALAATGLMLLRRQGSAVREAFAPS